MHEKFRKTTRQLMAVLLAVVIATLTNSLKTNVRGATMFRTSLVFATPPGALRVDIGPDEFERRIGPRSIDVSAFRQIRLVAVERVGSPTNVRIRLLTGGHTLDVVELSPRSEVTRVYDVPGMSISIAVVALGPGPGSNFVDIVIYGNE